MKHPSPQVSKVAAVVVFVLLACAAGIAVLYCHSAQQADVAVGTTGAGPTPCIIPAERSSHATKNTTPLPCTSIQTRAASTRGAAPFFRSKTPLTFHGHRRAIASPYFIGPPTKTPPSPFQHGRFHDRMSRSRDAAPEPRLKNRE